MLFEQRRRRELRTYSYVFGAAAIDTNIFIADKPCLLKEVRYVNTIAAASATLDIKKCTGTVIPSAGTTMLASVILLDSTINTVNTKTLSATASVLKMEIGDRIGADFSGTLTGMSTEVQLVIETL